MTEIVIPSWNTRELLLDCLRRLNAEASGGHIIVVDNASTDGSAEAVAAGFPGVQLVRNERNLGFAAAVNRGLRSRRARDRPVLLLNADTQPSADLPDGLARALSAMPDVAALSPRLLTAAGDGQRFAFGGDPNLRYILRRGWNRLVSGRALHDWNPQVPIAVDWVSFACVLLAPRALEQVGELDEDYFMYFEDCDWCLRARRAGWRIVYDPTLSITHLCGASLKRNPAAAAAYGASLLRFYRLHQAPWQRVVLRLLLPFYRRLAVMRP